MQKIATYHSILNNKSTIYTKFFKANLLALFVLLSFVASAQNDTLYIRQGTNYSSIATGNMFIDTVNYSWSSFTKNALNTVAVLTLPQNLVPFVISPFSNSVAFDPSQVSSVTYNSLTNTINIAFVSPLPAGSTGQLQIKFKYLNGSTPNGYAPSIVSSINASNYTDTNNVAIGPSINSVSVIAIAANNYTISKSIKAGGAIDDQTIYQLDINGNGGVGSLDLKNPIVIDTLPAGAVFVKATPFAGSSLPVYDALKNTVTWTWATDTVISGYSSSAYLSVNYPKPTFALHQNVCNHANLSGTMPILPIGTDSATAVSGSICRGLDAPTSGASCNGGGISAATAWWLDHHVLAGTTCNWFSNGWYNSGNTSLNEVDLTYSIDKSVDFNTIKVRPVKDGFDSVATASIEVSYATHLHPAFTVLGTYQSTEIADGTTPVDHTPVIAPGDYITQVSFKVTGNLPLGSKEDLSYCGDVRTTATGAKDGSAILEGTYNPASSIGDDGTVIHNISSGGFSYNGTADTYSACSDSAEIIFAQPAFHDSYKSILNSSNQFKASDTVNYQFHTYLGGNDQATTVVVKDTLDSKLDYVSGSSTYTIGSGSPVTITPDTSRTSNGRMILTYNLGTINPGKDYYINLSAEIHPGTLPRTIWNKFTLTSNNALFTTTTDSVDLSIITAVALRAYKGQSGCDPNYVYYPVNAVAQAGGPVNYKITLKNLGNVAAKDLVMVDVFPFISDYRGSQWYANLAGNITINDPSSTVYYTTVSNPCYSDFNPSTSPSGCNTPSWSTTAPADITTVKAIKITRSAVLQVLDSITLTWAMRAPVDVPQGLLMDNSIMFQVSRNDNSSQLLPAVPNKVGMYTNCTPTGGSLGNYAWIDTNKNGIQDEPANLGLNGVKVYLYSPGLDGVIGGGDDILLDSSITGNNWGGNPGYYKFVNLSSGKYYVNFPTNYNQYKITPVVTTTDKTDGNSDADLTTGNSEIVTIDANGTGQDKDNTTIDAGFYPTGTIGNYVWYDVNGNGTQDDGSANGINGVKVYLYKDTLGAYVIKDSAITANDASHHPGYYNFNIDQSGNYKVLFPTTNSTKVLTTQTVTPKTDNNSDADVSTGFSPVIVMNLLSTGRNKNNPTIDAGYRCNVPTPVITGNLQLCNGFNTTLSASGNPSYKWYKDGSLIVGANNQTLTTTNAGGVPSPAGSYTVTSTDTGGCTSAYSAAAVVTIPAAPAQPTITPLGNTTFCSGNSLQLSSSTATTYQWYKDGAIIAGETGKTTWVTQSGNYTVVTTNNLGCVSVASAPMAITVNVTPAPDAPVLTSTPQYCIGQVVLTSTAASAYQWLLNGSVIPSANSQTYIAQQTGDYSVVLTGPQGCISAPSAVTHAFVNVTPTPIIQTSGTPQLCGGSSVQLNCAASPNGSVGGYSTYQWYLDGNIINGANNLSYTTSTPGNYTVVTTIGTGCLSAPSAAIVVANVAPPAIPTITANPAPCSGIPTVLNSSSAINNQWYLNGSPISGATDQHYTANGLGNYYVVVTNGNCSATSAVKTVSKAVVANFTYQATTVSNTPCLSGNSISFTNTSVGATSYQWFTNDSLVSATQNTADTTFTTADTYYIKLIASNGAGCKDTITQPIYVYSCSVSSGASGGLESKSIGSVIGTRNFNLIKEGKNGDVSYPAEEMIATSKKTINTMGSNSSTLSLATLMPYKVSATYTAYDKSAAVTDLETFTNAIDVRAIDFTLNNSAKAVAFATKTIGGIYSHTKPICDRLKGAQLLNVENVTIQNYSFIRCKIQQPDGGVEYAISFSAGEKAGRSTYSIQSNWLMKDYIGEDTMINYQLWAASPVDVNTMVTEILSKLQSNVVLVQNNNNVLPTAYVSSTSRVGKALSLTVNNRTSNTNGYFELTQRANENSTIGSTLVVPFTVSPNAKSTVTISVGDNYDADIKMVFNNVNADYLYNADGIWGTSSDNNTRNLSLSVSNDENRTIASNEYPLLRNVQIQATTSSYVSLYKFLKGGGVAANLTGNKSFKFTATANTAGLNLRITIAKQGISNWNSQYSYLISNVQSGQTYEIGMSEFKSTDASLPSQIDLSDVTTVNYAIEVPSGQSTSINVGINNAAFTTEDVLYTRSLQVTTLNVSPNPNNGVFKVSFASPSARELRLSIVDLSGKVISSQLVNSSVGKNIVNVNLGRAINNSLYFVTLQGSGVKYDTQRAIIKK